MFKIIGAKSRDAQGNVHQRSLWWPMALGAIIDSFLNTLLGRGTLGFPSTMTIVERSMNQHTPTNQKISLLFVDADHPNRLLWGSEFTADSARHVATLLVHLAEQVSPLYTNAEYREALKQQMAEYEAQQNE